MNMKPDLDLIIVIGMITIAILGGYLWLMDVSKHLDLNEKIHLIRDNLDQKLEEALRKFLGREILQASNENPFLGMQIKPGKSIDQRFELVKWFMVWINAFDLNLTKHFLELKSDGDPNELINAPRIELSEQIWTGAISRHAEPTIQEDAQDQI